MVLKKRKSISVLFAAIVASALLLLVGVLMLGSNGAAQALSDTEYDPDSHSFEYTASGYVSTYYIDVNEFMTEVNSANDWVKFKLLKDVTLNSKLTVNENTDMTLDLNGHKLSFTYYSIELKGKLTLTDSAPTSTGNSVTSPVTNAKVPITGGVLTSENSHAVYVEGKGEFVMENGNISGCKGSGVYLYGDNSKFTMKKGVISHNLATGCGGGVNIEKGTFDMSGGSIINNRVINKFGNPFGGGVYLMSTANMNVSGNAIISGNTHGDGNITDNVTLNANTINVNGNLTSGARIGITKNSYGEVVTVVTNYTQSDEPSKFFFSDSGSYAIKRGAGNTGVLGEPDPVAEVTATGNNGTTWTEKYISFATAWEMATDSAPATVKLLADAETSASLTVAADKNITLDLNGHKLARVDDGDNVIEVAGTLTLADTGDNNVAHRYNVGSDGKWTFADDGKHTLYGGVITGGMYSGIYIDGGTFNMSGGAIAGNTANCGGGVRVFDGAFNMTGGTISGNTADYGGGVYINSGTFNMSDGAVIRGNTAAFGGGVCVSGGTFAMSGGNISANSVKERVTPCGGGGVYIDGGAFAMSGGVIGGDTAADANNSRNGDGGGVYLKSGTFAMSGGAEIRGNKAVSSGSGVYVSGGTFTMSSGVISDNNTTSNGSSGGGVRVYGGAFNMTGGTISGNTAAFGGGVCIVVGTFAMSGGSITNNVANYGGGVYFMGGAFEISGAVTVTGNKMKVTGIDIANNVYLSSGKVMTVTGALTAGANIGVKLAGGYSGAFTSGYGSYNKNGDKTIAPSAYFVSDDNTLCAQTTDTSPDEASLAAHSYSATYVWADDNSSCTASLLCSICGHASKTETASGSAITSVSSAATCTQGGYVGFKATFTDSAFEAQIKKTQETPATGHTLSSVALQPATCTQDGVLAHELCSVCGSIFVENEEKTEEELKISALGHDIVSQAAKAPTCTEVGWNAHEACSRCDYSTKVEIAALGHVEAVDSAVAPTCTEKGKTAGSHCSRCDAILTEQEEIAAIGHAWGAWTTTKAPTCTEEGSKQRVCDHDGEHKETQAIAAIGHAWGEWTTTKAPTCTEEGSKQRVCAHDGEHKETQAIAAIGHVEVTDAAVLPTCTEKGLTEGKHCSRCEAVLTAQEEVAALGHAWGEWTEVKASTLNEFGEETRVCAHDGEHKQTRQIPKRVPQLVKPDASGEVNQVEVTLPDGFKADVELVVTEIAEENYGEYEGIARAANGEIGFVYDVTLKSGGVAIQPDGTLTIKLLIPTELRGKSFKLFHLHGGEAVQTEYTVDGNYAVVTADKLSEFVFVGEKSSAAVEESNAAWIALIVLLCVIIVGEIAYVTLRKTGKIRFGGEK